MNPNARPTLVKTLLKALHKSLYAIALPILLASCGGGGDPTPTTPTPTLAMPILTDAPDQVYTVGQAIPTLPFPSSGGTVASCRITTNPALPTGLKLDASGTTCQITGTPAMPSGEATYTISATNTAGSDTATVKITVNAIIPALDDVSDQNYPINEDIPTLTFNNRGSAIQASGCIVEPALPAGLTLTNTTDNQTCQITGRPTMVSSQTTYTITATNTAGSGETTVKITVYAPVLISNVQLKSSVAQAIPVVGDMVELSFTTSGSTNNFAPQVSIGGEIATVMAGATAGEWTATLRVGANFASNNEGFEVIVIVPNGASPTEDLGQLVTVAATEVQNTPTPITLVDTDKTFLLTPILVLEPVHYRLEIGLEITPILFTNEGGDASDCVIRRIMVGGAEALPEGLRLVVAGSTCQIEGTPITLTKSRSSYPIFASNASGENQLSLTITVVEPPPLCADIEMDEVEGYPISSLTFEGSKLYVRGNHSNWEAQDDFLLKHVGTNDYQAVAVFDTEGAALNYDGQMTQFKLASGDDDLTTQLWVVGVDSEGTVGVADIPSTDHDHFPTS